MNNDIGHVLKDKKIEIDRALETLLKSDEPSHDTLFQSMNYSLLAGGKRIRPSLFLLTLDCLGVNSSKFLQIACAIECIHTYSLIHDDLPAMDNDRYRRGKLTNHTVFGAGMATQAGDGLQSAAFYLIASDRQASSDQKCELIQILSHAAGPCGMVGGQAQDLEMEGKKASLQELMELDRCKTGALLSACVDMASVIGSASESTVKALHDYGDHIGLLFQITDDILDFTGDAKVMGKMPGQDEIENKATFATIMGLDAAKQKAQAECDSAQKAVQSLGTDFSILSDLSEFILQRTF